MKHILAMIASLALPNHGLTPGAANPNVTQANIKTTICKVGWTATVRPSNYYTNKIKLQLLPKYGHTTKAPLDFELDHLISLELGGSPSDVRNLWPQPYAGTWGARKKDVVEKKLSRMVCAGTLKLADARNSISSNWIDAYQRYVVPATGGIGRHGRTLKPHRICRRSCRKALH